MRAIIFIELFLLFFHQNLLCTNRGSVTVIPFVENWVQFLEEDPMFNPDMNRFYRDSTIWYGSKVPVDGLYSILSMDRTLQIERVSGQRLLDTLEYSPVSARYKIYFEADPAAHLCAYYGHYIIVEEDSLLGLYIVEQSSVIYDAWTQRKLEIASSTISEQNRSYYVLHSDSFAFSTFIVCILTDTLGFFEPQYADVCGGFEKSGFSTAGKVFVAVISRRTNKIVRKREISGVIYAAHIEGNELVRGGYPCLVPSEKMKVVNGYLINVWEPPQLRWIDGKKGSKTLVFSTMYEGGDRCRVCNIVLRIGNTKRINVSSCLK